MKQIADKYLACHIKSNFNRKSYPSIKQASVDTY